MGYRKTTNHKNARTSLHRKSFLIFVYDSLSKIVITRAITQQVRKKYEYLCPSQELFIRKKTVQTILLTWGFILSELVLIFVRHPSIYHGFLSIVLAIILNYEMIQWNVRSLEIKLLFEFSQFIADVRHYYYVSHMVDEAILDALEHTKPEMRIQANQFYEILTSDHMEEMTEAYNLSTHNNYFHLFLALCVTVVEYGDRNIEERSLFLMNLSNLKTEINLELLKMRQMNYLYSGLTFVILTPMLLIKGIEFWAISNLPELEKFYTGSAGLVTLIAIIVTTLVVYLVVTDLKEFRFTLPNEHDGLDWLLNIRMIGHGIQNYSKINNNKLHVMRQLIDESGEKLTIKQYVLQRFLYALIGLLSTTMVSIYILYCNRSSVTKGMGLLHDNRYDWYELLIALLIAGFCYQVPTLKLLFHRKLTQMNKEDEVIRFQSIVLMLMYIEQVNVLEVLERVEEFANIFKKSIQNCINNYNYSDQMALEQLKYDEPYKPFQRFVDNLMISDEIGIERAFDEVASDRQHFQEKRKQDNQIRLEKRSAVAKFIAYIPAILVIGGYLILPFLIECFVQLDQYSDMMGSMY